MEQPRATSADSADAGEPSRKARGRKRVLASVEAEVEWSKVERRFKGTDARTLLLLREAFLAGYLHVRRYRT